MQLILDPMHQNGFIVTVYDEEGLRLATTEPCPTPALAFAEGRNIVDNKISRGLRSGSADAPVPKDVRCYSNSGKTRARLECPLCTFSGFELPVWKPRLRFTISSSWHRG